MLWHETGLMRDNTSAPLLSEPLRATPTTRNAARLCSGPSEIISHYLLTWYILVAI